MKALFARFVRDDQGQDLIEYALLGSFVSLAAYLGANFLGTELNNWYNAVGGAVSDAASNVPDIGGGS
jgi:Flp pilus assembly pilin Flp